MPDNGKIGLRELRSCIRSTNDALLHLNRSIVFFEHARKLRLDVPELRRIEALLNRDVLGPLVDCMEKSLGPEDRN